MSDDTTPPAVLRGVTKRYGDAVAVDGLDLEIGRGEFLSLLGPSGCGKTTTLRMLAGFEVPDAGTILLDGRDVTSVPPYRRNVNTVFQSYALFEHLSVADNIAFGLKRSKVGRAEIRRRVGEMLELVQLAPRAESRPSQLSGGQQQRVALARALVNRPALLLLDEPLGALDLKLRREMQIELKAIQRELGITFVFVTHDQEEALSMSDRIGVMSDGRLRQLGTSAEIYRHPANAFVAGFIGTSNLMPAEVSGADLRVAGRLSVPLPGGRGGAFADGAHVLASVRPERLRVVVPGGEDGDGAARLGADVVDVVYLGATTNVLLDAGAGIRLIATTLGDGGAPIARGGRVDVVWDPADTLVLEAA
ncbi:MAG TPA: ABC transporter ATP-binding protein [Baekduia sp.]|uniref:ABC transporter ATP-binding protein n=1 Tax=Baekduia sp. TaxID=2600305 RepID=UPI002D7787DA|nr:ABC transporter ATP-binding protein [Baekduia sp.]HET6507356.1 ABC transporter ATP-binding protein [Baekduia sp.]